MRAGDPAFRPRTHPPAADRRTCCPEECRSRPHARLFRNSRGVGCICRAAVAPTARFLEREGIAGDADGSPPHETDDVPHETRAVRAAGDESRGVCRNRRGAGEPHLKIRRIDFVRQQHSEPCRRPHVPEPSPPVSQGAGPNEGSVSGNGRPGGLMQKQAPGRQGSGW